MKRYLSLKEYGESERGSARTFERVAPGFNLPIDHNSAFVDRSSVGSTAGVRWRLSVRNTRGVKTPRYTRRIRASADPASMLKLVVPVHVVPRLGRTGCVRHATRCAIYL